MSRAAVWLSAIWISGHGRSMSSLSGASRVNSGWSRWATATKYYLDTGSFSKQSLFDQLTSDYANKFLPEEAQYAIDNLDVDWNAEALEAAESYLDTGSFSEQGLYDQLTSTAADEFTAEEAQYALDNVEADWNEEALEAAESYYDMGMTDLNEIYNQITSAYADKFTADQAQYAIDNLDPSTLNAQ